MSALHCINAALMSSIDYEIDPYEQNYIRFLSTDYTIKGLMWLNKQGVMRPAYLYLIDFTLGAICSVIERTLKLAINIIGGLFYFTIHLGQGNFDKCLKHIGSIFLAPVDMLNIFEHICLGYAGVKIATTPYEEIKRSHDLHVTANCAYFREVL